MGFIIYTFRNYELNALYKPYLQHLIEIYFKCKYLFIFVTSENRLQKFLSPF